MSHLSFLNRSHVFQRQRPELLDLEAGACCVWLAFSHDAVACSCFALGLVRTETLWANTLRFTK
jgi:hypothetical protein